MFAVTPFLRVGFVKFPGSGVKGCGWVGVWKKDGSCFARMPTHAMRLHEWGTRGIGAISCMGHPPTRLRCRLRDGRGLDGWEDELESGSKRETAFHQWFSLCSIRRHLGFAACFEFEHKGSRYCGGASIIESDVDSAEKIDSAATSRNVIEDEKGKTARAGGLLIRSN
jgi:hypothetical protein